MKKIVFLVIASLMVMGLVLPGCGGGGGGGGFTNWITVGVVCPMDVVHGQQQWLCAEWAVEEINAAGGVNITVGPNTTNYGVRVTKINTRTEEDPALAQAALIAVIDDVDYVIGGFRTETVFPLVETTMDQQKLFLIAGAATANILRLTAWNDTRYKYVFRGTPFNDVFLLTNMYKYLGTLASIFTAHNISKPFPLAVIAENLAWTATMRAILAYDLLGKQALLGYTNATVVTCSPTQSDLSGELTTLNGTNPLVVMPILSAAVCGAAYSSQRPSYLPYAVSFGINVAGQVQSIWTQTSGGVEGEMFLDSYGDGLLQTTTTASFLSGFATRSTLATGDYPMYTATVYDVLKGLVADIKAANSLDDNALVTQMRSGRFYETAGALEAGYYPMPEITLAAGGNYSTKVMALSAAQAYALYPHLVEFYGYANFSAMEANWTAHQTSWTTNPGGFVPNDLVYGPGMTTGIITEWQDIGGTGKKVGVWPNAPASLGPLLAYANVPAHSVYLANATHFAMLKGLGLIDQYGNWVINYTGTQPIVIDPAIIVAHGGS